MRIEIEQIDGDISSMDVSNDSDDSAFEAHFENRDTNMSPFISTMVFESKPKLHP